MIATSFCMVWGLGGLRSEVIDSAKLSCYAIEVENKRVSSSCDLLQAAAAVLCAYGNQHNFASSQPNPIVIGIIGTSLASYTPQNYRPPSLSTLRGDLSAPHRCSILQLEEYWVTGVGRWKIKVFRSQQNSYHIILESRGDRNRAQYCSKRRFTANLNGPFLAISYCRGKSWDMNCDGELICWPTMILSD